MRVCVCVCAYPVCPYFIWMQAVIIPGWTEFVCMCLSSPGKMKIYAHLMVAFGRNPAHTVQRPISTLPRPHILLNALVKSETSTVPSTIPPCCVLSLSSLANELCFILFHVSLSHSDLLNLSLSASAGIAIFLCGLSYFNI